MRISDWSSDVCSSDLERLRHGDAGTVGRREHRELLRAAATHRHPGRRVGAQHRFERSREGATPYLQIEQPVLLNGAVGERAGGEDFHRLGSGSRSEEHTSELQSLMRISYAVFCLKKKN